MISQARIWALKLMIPVIVVLQGCTIFGAPNPDTFNQKLAVAVATNSQVRNTATTLLQAGKIDAKDAQNILAQTDVTREGLNVARGLSGTDLDSATGRLEATQAALKALQAYLLTKQGAQK